MVDAKRSALVAGVGMIPFGKPGKSGTYVEMGSTAIGLALKDAGVGFDEVEQAYAGYVFGDSCSGQKVIYKAGMTGIPIINANNNCSSGSTALYLARQAIEGAAAECALVVGFEQMVPGALGQIFTDRPTPADDFEAVCAELFEGDVPLALKFFCGAGQQYMERYGATLADFAKVRAKASRHGARNPLSIFQTVLTEEDVLASPAVWPGVMTRLMACPPTCGAAAAVLVSPDFARRHGLTPAVRIAAQAMTTDLPNTFNSGDMIKLVGSDVTRRAAAVVYDMAGVGPDDIDVVELHDCFAQNEVITYEALGLCETGGAPRFIADGDNTYGGRIVTNPSGGLLSKGHPLGATGLAQCYELNHQLRGSAAQRQVDNVRLALQHNLGTGSACVVTLYEKAT
jgi:acetyl-CoA acetyltransferase